jgi:hypothetical protein
METGEREAEAGDGSGGSKGRWKQQREAGKGDWTETRDREVGGAALM